MEMKTIDQLFRKFILFYLRILAKLQLKKFSPFVIGVGGASGKTSLANFIYLILSSKYKVKQGRGKNSETGIPLDILNLSNKNYSKLDWLRIVLLSPLKIILDWKRFDIYIAEMGIDSPLEPKNMSYLLKIVKPQVGVLTNISYEHSQYFDPLVENVNQKDREEDILELTAKQEGLLLTSLPKKGIAVLNIDDENIRGIQNQVVADKITVSAVNKHADYYIEKIQNFVDSFAVNFVHENKKYKIEISNPLPKHFAYSFVLAIAASFTKLKDIDKAIEILKRDFSLPAGRMTVFKGIKDTVLIDSSYNNATLTPILDLLDFIKDIGRARRRVGIIGDMRELGTMSKTMHEQVAKKILETLDLAILIGPLSQKYIEPIIKRDKFEYMSFSNVTSAKNEIINAIKPKDMILIKGSQNTLFLERVVEMLLKDSKDSDKLCRRGEFWDKIRLKSL
jgi:MurE/MurF fusion protein